MAYQDLEKLDPSYQEDVHEKIARSTLIKARFKAGLALLACQRKEPYQKIEQLIHETFKIIIDTCEIIEDDCSPEALRPLG